MLLECRNNRGTPLLCATYSYTFKRLFYYFVLLLLLAETDPTVNILFSFLLLLSTES
jgi:hypothetical protein